MMYSQRESLGYLSEMGSIESRSPDNPFPFELDTDRPDYVGFLWYRYTTFFSKTKFAKHGF